MPANISPPQYPQTPAQCGVEQAAPGSVKFGTLYEKRISANEMPYAPAKARKDLRQAETTIEMVNVYHTHWCVGPAIFALNSAPNGDPHAWMLLNNQETRMQKHGNWHQ